MSNLETAPVEFDCVAGSSESIEILEPRDVPLGGPRAMRVRRTLPQRQRSLIGAWCFADHYGPEDVRTRPGMDVPPHPHTGLQTVSWLFAGEIEHRDSGGVHALVHPGELNLMTAGGGICHSEVSTPATTTLHGVQLWVALPDSARDTARGVRSLCTATGYALRRGADGVSGLAGRPEVTGADPHPTARRADRSGRRGLGGTRRRSDLRARADRGPWRGRDLRHRGRRGRTRLPGVRVRRCSP